MAFHLTILLFCPQERGDIRNLRCLHCLLLSACQRSGEGNVLNRVCLFVCPQGGPTNTGQQWPSVQGPASNVIDTETRDTNRVGIQPGLFHICNVTGFLMQADANIYSN